MSVRARISWTLEEDEKLRDIYAMSSAGRSSRALADLAVKKGCKRSHCRARALRLGLSRVAGSHRPWTKTEIENLEQYAGRMPVYRIAKILGRSREAIICKLHLLKISGRVRKRGYTRRELAELIGIDLQRNLGPLLDRWPMETNLFGNFAQDEVALWIWDHLEHLELRKMNQPWLKGMLKESAAS